ncbi:Cna B-type domain-containing protein [Firmicutes bacterium AF12-30]|nr:Cna B-type domain-containing protein [Firmicutes bacterium AF12-30]
MNQEETMKYKLKRKLKKIGTFFLALLTLFSSLFGGMAGMPALVVNVAAKEGTATVGMSQVMDCNKISALNRSASEGLWKITANGKGTFCLNSGKSMCNGDTVKYKTHNAVTYKNQGVAKALTYYYWKSPKNIKAFALTQAYIWACGAGVSKKTTIYQAGKNLDDKFSSSDAKAFCDKIKKTDPKGTIYYYTVTHCVKGKKHDKHQMLYRMTKDVTPAKTGSYTYSDSTSESDQTEVKITKRDQATAVVLSGVKFQFFRDGKSVGTAVTDEKGVASLTYNETISSGTRSITEKYVKNWNELSKDDQESYTEKGYYDSEAKAKAAAKKEVAKLLQGIIEDKRSKTHTWTAKEIEADARHNKNTTTKTKKATGKTAKVDLGSMYDTEKTIDLELNKRSILEDFGTDATYANAEYGVYARSDILASDNKTVRYKKDSEVATIIIDATGYGCAKKLPVGEYYVKEKNPPKGFELNKDSTNITLNNDQLITVYETPVKGKLQIHKTYDNDKKAESGAVFEIYDSKNQLVDTITTGSDGIATSKELPYGSYRLHQTKGTDGFSKIPDMIKVIDGSIKTYQIKANNPREAAAISISKTKVITDTQTSTNTERPEAGAKFEIIRKSDQKVVETLTTDENGYASSRQLDPGTYTVHQIKGSDNYAFVKDFDVTLKDGDKTNHMYDLKNPWIGKKLMIKKTMEKNKVEEAEVSAEFTILDASKADGYKNTDLDTEENRKDYIYSLAKDAVIGTITTDAKGIASFLLEDLKADHDFIVVQTKGAEGYDLAPVYDSRDHKPKEVDGMKVYEFTAKDVYSDSASIQIKKEKKVSDTKTEAETGAVFELIDQDGKVVTTLTTGEDGTATASGIALGMYTLHQKSGSNKHAFLEDQVIVLTKKDKGKTIKYSYADQENEIDFVLVKRSRETKKLLNDAEYVIYDDDGKEVARLTSGTMKDGYATCKLPYGHYTIKEVSAPNGYNKNDAAKEFTLDLQSVDYDSDGNGTYTYEDTDEPVYGSVSLKKTGETLSGFEDASFVYENDQISGAVYGLYAKEDIQKDDGMVVWKAGTLIDQKTTLKDKAVQFTRKGDDGKDTTEFYQGTYYVKEISGPNGYCIDTEEHEVVINWDTKPGTMNDIRDTEDVPDVEEPHGNNTPSPNGGIYVLETGEALNQEIQDAESITFTWENAPDGTDTKDVSQDKNGSIVLWNDGNDYYISSQKADQIIYMNTVSSKMFSECKSLTKINFKNIDTSKVADMSEMFANCSALKELDLSSFNTSNVEDVRKMFYGCTNLKTTYAQDQMVKSDDDYTDAKVTGISATPKTDFVKGAVYHADDFAFSSDYDDDGQQELTDVTDDDVTFEPETAEAAGKQKVTISFKDSGKYKGYDPIETTVNVIDPEDVDVFLDTDKHIDINLECNDLLQKYSIQFIKTDKKGEMLPGAKFALKAACEIVNKDEKTIFHKGDTIATTVSGDDQFGYLEFFGLPTGIYAKDGVGKEMYTVEEVEAPLGYGKSDETMTFSGEVLNDQTADFIHDVATQGNTNNDEITYVHDSKTLVNNPSDYVQVKKYWIDDNNSMNTRPVSVTIKAENKNTHEVKTYVLNKDNNWAMQTDIKRGEEGNYTFSEVCNAANYTRVSEAGGDWDKNTYTLSYTNKYDKGGSVKLVVKKNWDDSNNSDGIRPDSVNIKLYRNGTDMQKDQILSAANNWTAEFNDLPKEDDLGEKYEYEVKEDSSSVVNGNAKTGYEIAYEVKESTDKSSDITTITTNITNTHKPKTVQKTIRKVWDDENDQDKIRPDSVRFNLLANGKDVVDTVTLNSENGWKTRSKVLPKCENGNEIEYTWEEVKEGVVIGNEQIGYKVSYDDEDDSDTTIATNSHTPGRGSITITKELDPSNLNMDVGDATFTFTLTGTDVYGKKHTYKKDVKFIKSEVENFVKANPGTMISLSTTFDDLYYGTYTCCESGMKEYFKLDHLSTTSTNGRVDQKAGTVTFDIGSEGSSASAKITGEATFRNQMIKGNIKLKKKDSKGKVLKGVRFTIKDSDGKEVTSKETDEKGELLFDDLLPDTYTITETKTVSGKNLLKEPLVVTLPLSVTQAEVDKGNVDTSNAIKQGDTYYFYHPTYEITNDANLKLPTTGGFNNIKAYVPLIGGFALILAVVFYYFKKKKGIVIFRKK